MYENIKELEKALQKKALAYVKNEMDGKDKDRIYKISIGQVGWEVKKETLPAEQYNKIRDEFVAKQLTYYGLVEDVHKFDKDTVKPFSKKFYKAETAGLYQANAIKALEKNFKEQTAEILAVTGETKLDPTKMKYLGDQAYSYADTFIINFENSPSSVEIRYMVNY